MFDDFLIMQFFDDNGRLIKDADFSRKRVTDYTYDKKGNKKEVFTFPLPDTDFSRQYDSIKGSRGTAQN